ncbi:MAG: hypothetical protein HW405_983 [Candidatus Berkelbacteria bacterium]|nr:hypothetical protein [Candidatus Berkelbacteria bacterium]
MDSIPNQRTTNPKQAQPMSQKPGTSRVWFVFLTVLSTLLGIGSFFLRIGKFPLNYLLPFILLVLGLVLSILGRKSAKTFSVIWIVVSIICLVLFLGVFSLASALP